MQGYVIREQSSVDLVECWFGQAGIVELPSELIHSFFQSIILTREQIIWENDQ